DQRHRVPADRARPKLWRQTGLRIRPSLLFRFIPTVIEQTGFRVARMRFPPDELPSDIVERTIFVKGRGVLGIKRLTHVQAVQPHLIGIDFLMPETALVCAGVSSQVLSQLIGSFFVFFFFSDSEER